MDKKPNEIHEKLIPTKLTNMQYSTNSYTTITTPYNWPAFLAASCLNIEYMSTKSYVCSLHLASIYKIM